MVTEHGEIDTMNRRNFLKSVGVACGLAVAAPLKLLAEKKPFKPNPIQQTFMYGGCPVRYNTSLDDGQEKWPVYAITYSLSEKEIKALMPKLREAIDNTKFIKPLFI
jgi:hypothetical protein